MSDQRDQQQGTGGFRMAALIMLPPLLYALSIGPAWCLCAAMKAGEDAFLVFYGPLLSVSKLVGLGMYVSEYVNWWASLFGLLS